MNARLRQSVIQAEAALPADAQEQLAEIVEAFTANHGLTPELIFTPEELEHIERIAAEPFEPADPAEVKAFFERE
jgi:hypothetical protein